MEVFSNLLKMECSSVDIVITETKVLQHMVFDLSFLFVPKNFISSYPHLY
jgi:hypothetical protein